MVKEPAKTRNRTPGREEGEILYRFMLRLPNRDSFIERGAFGGEVREPGGSRERFLTAPRAGAGGGWGSKKGARMKEAEA